MAIGAIGGCTDSATEALQRGTAFKAPGEPPLSPAAEANRLDEKSRDNDLSFILDLRVNPAEDTAQTAARRDYEGAAAATGQSSGGANTLVAAASINQPVSPDAPARQRSADQTYQAVEASDAKVAPLGGIYDLSI